MGHGVVATDDQIASRLTIEKNGDLTVCRVRTGRIKGARRIERGIYEFRLSGVVWRRAQEFLRGIDADLIVYYSPTIFLGTSSLG